YREAESTAGKPTAVVAKTIKGKGYSKVENQNGWHGKGIAEEAIEELGGLRKITVDIPKPEQREPRPFEPEPQEWPAYDVGAEISTRKAYGEALPAPRGDGRPRGALCGR